MARFGTVFERVLLRDRWVVVTALVAATLLSWGYLFSGAGMKMAAMPGMMKPEVASGWSPGQAVLMFVMWWVMMLAMMLPSAAPMILLFASLARRSGRTAATALFVSGYLLTWGGFSVVATFLQWILTGLDVLPGMRIASNPLAGLFLLAAGLYQLTPAKTACLQHCRVPVQFVTEYWRPGRIGALEMGLRHGAYCLGCCWALMALLFVGGVMNFIWVGVLTVYVLIEKNAPRGQYFSRLTATGLIATGAVLLMTAVP